MSTPTKPERVEVGQRAAGQRYRLDDKKEIVLLRPGKDPGDWEFIWKTAHLVKEGCVRLDGVTGLLDEEMLRDWDAVLIAPAPATPGTATVTPHDQTTCMHCAGGIACPAFAATIATRRDCQDCGKGVVFGEDGCCAQCGRDTRLACGDSLCGASDCPDCARKQWPESPVYGRMIGELRAPDGTPRTALEAIRAKRKPEPWVPSCDIDCDIPDADEGWRR